jgi:DNA-binding PucR family transcriptional regulator
MTTWASTNCSQRFPTSARWSPHPPLVGHLLDYDTTKSAQLVDTLHTYLECGGNYDLTAKALSLHRSTLRYRPQRIRDPSGYDLADPDTRFDLQLATRAWKTW